MKEQLGLTQTAFLALVTASPQVLCEQEAAQQLGTIALFLRRALHCGGPLFSTIAARCPAIFAMQVFAHATGHVICCLHSPMEDDQQNLIAPKQRSAAMRFVALHRCLLCKGTWTS